MARFAADFLDNTRTKSFDRDHRRIINFNIGKYVMAVARGLSKFSNLATEVIRCPRDLHPINRKMRYFLTGTCYTLQMR